MKLINIKQATIFFIALLLCFTYGCGKYKGPIPPVPVDFYIYPNDVTYLNLNYYGGHEYVTGGVNGIVVYRIGEWEFSAFDRACPYDWDEPDAPRVIVDDSGIILKCEKCGTMYNILDGSVILGLSEYSLRQYYTRFDGYRLRIHN